MDKQAKKLQESLSYGLKIEAKNNEEFELAQAAYDEKLAIFHEENPDLVEALELAKKSKVYFKKVAADIKVDATQYLSDTFFDDLPEGFVQKKKMVFDYHDEEMFLVAIKRFHHLLVLDKKMVEKFLKDNTSEVDDEPIVDDSIGRFVNRYVSVKYQPLPNISNATLLKLDTEPVIE